MSIYSKEPLLNISIKTKEKQLYKGLAYTISSINSGGKFDVLPYHANFITLISQYVLIDAGLTTQKTFEMEKGVLYVMNNYVEIYFGI